MLLVNQYLLFVLSHFIKGLSSQVRGFICGRRECFVDVLAVLEKDRTNESRVDIHRPVVGDRKKTPNQEDDFDKPIKRKPTEYNGGEELDATEEGKHNPICEPLRVVVLVVAFKCVNGSIGWI